MKKRLHKIATFCMIGTLTFAGNTLVSHAAELPVAGIDVVLNEFYLNVPSTNVDIEDYLNQINSEYKDIGISKVNNYVNIRKKASEDSKIAGKLYSNSAATILEAEDDWYKIKSGSVTGYIKSEYLVTGEEVEKLATKVGNRIATVNTTTLKVREKASQKAAVLTLVPTQEELEVVKETEEWVKVSIDEDVTGYVSSDYVDLRTEFKEAESIKEEKARLKAEKEARKVEEEARKVAEEGSNTNRSESNTNTVTASSSRNVSSSSVSNSSNSGNSNSSTTSSNSSSSKRDKIVDYAFRFLGNPYVWGGTSLSNGADCSGFTQSVFRDNGISIPRVSGAQASSGRTTSIDNMKKGDLIFYTRGGSVNHVAIYIGNGQVIHASSPKTGIRISNYNYRTPYKVVNYID